MIDTMMQKLLSYVQTQELGPISTSFDDSKTVLEVVCSRCPTKEHLRHLEQLIFFTDKLKVTHSGGELVSADENTISIQIAGYYQFASIYQMLTEMHSDVTEAKISYPSEIIFTYFIVGRCVLSYMELEQLQNVINPMIEDHDSIRVMGMQGEYSMRVDLKR